MTVLKQKWWSKSYQQPTISIGNKFTKQGDLCIAIALSATFIINQGCQKQLNLHIKIEINIVGSLATKNSIEKKLCGRGT